MNYPKTIRELIECYKKLPGVGEKTAERMALATLSFDDSTINLFSESIKNLKLNTKRCKRCNSLSENELCTICKNDSRDSKKICVVSDAKDVILFEKIGNYNGKYFVLNNLISPLKGIQPESINFNDLFNLIENELIQEVILAVKPNFEGETTALYISKKLENKNVCITKIAHGIPMGAEMEYIDSLTIELAFENRKPI